MASETRFVHHDVMQKKISAALEMRTNSDDVDTIIRFTHSEAIGFGWIESPEPMIYGEPKRVAADRGIGVLLSDMKLLSERRRYTEILAEELSSFGVEEHLQAAIIEDIFREVEVAVPGFQIIVFLRSVKETPCGICKECLGAVEEDEPMMITRLPCSHWYHGDCINLWLERNHFCPLCRYAMPIVEEPSRPSGLRRLHCPRLIMSAAVIIIGLLLGFADY